MLIPGLPLEIEHASWCEPPTDLIEVVLLIVPANTIRATISTYALPVAALFCHCRLEAGVLQRR